MKTNYETTFNFNIQLTSEEVNMMQQALHKAWSCRKEHEKVMLEKAEDGTPLPSNYDAYREQTDFIKDMRNTFARAIGVHYMGIDELISSGYIVRT